MSTERARAHAKHVWCCTCGKAVRGNGAKAMHRAMHARRGDGHHGITYEDWRKRYVSIGDGT